MTNIAVSPRVSLNTYKVWESFLLDMFKSSKHYMDYLQYIIFFKKQKEGISKFFLSEMTILGFSSLLLASNLFQGKIV